jgi:AcrR family transcriptional regulator
MERERRILDEAAALFHEKGFHGVGMDELGARAGLSGPALYRHFSGKNEILAALFNEALDELVAATVTIEADPADDLRRMVRHHVGYTLSHRALVGIYQREDRTLGDPWRTMFARRRRRYVERWEAAVARRFPTADPEAVALTTQSCLGLIFSMAYWPTSLAESERAAEMVEGFTSSGVAMLDRIAGDRA